MFCICSLQFDVPGHGLWARSSKGVPGSAEGEGLIGPRPHHFFAPPPPVFALKRKIIKIKKKDLKQVFSVYIPLYSLYFL